MLTAPETTKMRLRHVVEAGLVECKDVEVWLPNSNTQVLTIRPKTESTYLVLLFDFARMKTRQRTLRRSTLLDVLLWDQPGGDPAPDDDRQTA